MYQPAALMAVCLPIVLLGCGGGETSTLAATATDDAADATASSESTDTPNLTNLAGQPTQTITTLINGAESEEIRIFDERSRNLQVSLEDNDLDGLTDLTVNFRYDQNDCNDLQESFDASDVVVSRIELDQRPDCNFTTRSEDRNPTGSDGVVDRVVTQAFNEADLVSLIQTDNEGDGIFDRIEALEYDSEGNLARRDIDLDGDGSIDSSTNFEYANGQLVRETLDSNADGITDRVITTQTVAGSGSNSQRIVETDDGNDGTINSRQLLELDAQGNEVRWVTGYQLDGTHVGQETRRTFNAGNQVIRIEIDADADALFERERDFTYDEEGNFSTIRFLQDGLETFREDYVYEDWTIGQLD